MFVIHTMIEKCKKSASKYINLSSSSETLAKNYSFSFITCGTYNLASFFSSLWQRWWQPDSIESSYTSVKRVGSGKCFISKAAQGWIPWLLGWECLNFQSLRKDLPNSKSRFQKVYIFLISHQNVYKKKSRNSSVLAVLHSIEVKINLLVVLRT